MNGAKTRSIQVPGWLWGIFAGAGLAFVGGFYVPLQDANATHIEQFKQLSNEYKQAIAGYEKTHAKLTAVEKVRDEQKVKLGKISDAKSSAEKALDDLLASVESTLESEIKNKLVSVRKSKNAVAISLEALYLIYPHKTFVHDRGKGLLCSITKAIPKGGEHPTQVFAHANGDTPWSGILKKQFTSSWQLSATVASEVAMELSTCGVAGSDLRAVGAAHFKGDPKLSRKSVARIEIFVYPPSE